MWGDLPRDVQELIKDVSNLADENSVPLYLVGGFVRDVLLRFRHYDLDFVVEGDGIAFTYLLVETFGGSLQTHRDFGTAIWFPGSDETARVPFVDIVTARRESYPQPGALPVVIPSTIEDDLRRRDFTINAMAVQLAPLPGGKLIDPLYGQRDLEDKIVRVLHDSSFMDDATRIFRAARYAQRYDFHLDTHTESLIPAALPALATISGERLRTELDRILSEPLNTPNAVLRQLERWNVLNQKSIGLEFDEWPQINWTELGHLTVRKGTDRPTPFGQAVQEIRLARCEVSWIILACRVKDVEALGSRLALPATLTALIQEGQRLIGLLPALDRPLKPSAVVKLLERRGPAPVQAVEAAYWVAGQEREQARQHLSNYSTTWRDVRPTLTGDDLKARGLKPGPAFRDILWALRQAYLDGEISTPEQERALLDRLFGEESQS